MEVASFAKLASGSTVTASTEKALAIAGYFLTAAMMSFAFATSALASVAGRLVGWLGRRRHLVTDVGKKAGQAHPENRGVEPGCSSRVHGVDPRREG